MIEHKNREKRYPVMKADRIEISHPEKILFPDSSRTKKDLACYYRRIGGQILPYLEGRPLTLYSCPEGVGKDGFFIKHAPEHFPDFIERIKVPMRGDNASTMTMATVSSPEGLVYLAGQNAIELHVGLAHKDHLECPDQLVFDFDPPGGDQRKDAKKLRRVVICLGDLLQANDIPAYLKTTGSRGYHVHVPLRPQVSFAEVKSKAGTIAKRLQEELPEEATLAHSKNKRHGRVYIDIERNNYGQTVIAPYSVRAKPAAPIAVPIAWDELRERGTRPDAYSMKNIFRRLGHVQDPWYEYGQSRISPDRLDLS